MTSAAPTGSVANWRIAPEPRVQIGAADGDPSQLLYRVFSARSLAQSRMLVSNSGTHELRVYDSIGALRASFGGEGAGPGEFSTISSMRLLGSDPDTAFVVDSGNRRINVFSIDSGFVRSFSPASLPGYGRPSVLDMFLNREWLAIAPIGSGTLDGEPGDLIRMGYGIFAYNVDGVSARLIAMADARPRIVNSLGGGARHFPYVPLTPEPLYAVVGDALALVTGGRPEFRVIDRSGTVQRIVRWSPPRTPVGDIWPRFTEAYLDEVEEDRRPAYARLLATDDLPVPEFVPAAQSLVSDRLGFVWAERYRLPWESARLWDVFDGAGAWLGSIELPADVTVLEIGADYVVGRHRDAFGVERVVLHDLTR